MTKLGKYFEQFVRQYKAYVLPSRYNNYIRLKKHALDSSSRAKKLEDDSPTVCLDFSSTKIDSDHGRYLFQLVKEIELAGYQVAYKDRFRFLCNFFTKGYKKHLVTEFLIFYREEKELKNVVMLFSDSKKVIQRSEISKTVLVDYSKRAALKEEISMLFARSPDLFVGGDVEAPEPENLDDMERPISILMAGNIDIKRYNNPDINNRFGMMSRYQIAEVLRSQSQIDMIEPMQQINYDALLEAKELLLMNTQCCRVQFSNWLELLSKSEFFIAGPGGHMPLCHNLVEALSMGSIPILQYAEYLKPELVDGVNCLTYKDEVNLITTLQRALDLSAEKKLAMKQAAVDYYESHLKAGMLVGKILSNPRKSQTLVLFDFCTKG